jgi:hypothetical protein
MNIKVDSIRAVARLAAASPRLRRFLIGLLNRAPVAKRRLKQALARANTLASQGVAATGEADAEVVLLSRQARHVLRDLRLQTARIEARRVVAGQRD